MKVMKSVGLLLLCAVIVLGGALNHVDASPAKSPDSVFEKDTIGVFHTPTSYDSSQYKIARTVTKRYTACSPVEATNVTVANKSCGTVYVRLVYLISKNYEIVSSDQVYRYPTIIHFEMEIDPNINTGRWSAMSSWAEMRIRTQYPGEQRALPLKTPIMSTQTVSATNTKQQKVAFTASRESATGTTPKKWTVSGTYERSKTYAVTSSFTFDTSQLNWLTTNLISGNYSRWQYVYQPIWADESKRKAVVASVGYLAGTSYLTGEVLSYTKCKAYQVGPNSVYSSSEAIPSCDWWCEVVFTMGETTTGQMVYVKNKKWLVFPVGAWDHGDYNIGGLIQSGSVN
ncbi:MAG: hypothetical protein IK055_08795 [Lachnospiraceae bacterium]|nr:hypothetical protein [Lachnospiraceae bacterium]